MIVTPISRAGCTNHPPGHGTTPAIGMYGSGLGMRQRRPAKAASRALAIAAAMAGSWISFGYWLTAMASS